MTEGPASGGASPVLSAQPGQKPIAARVSTLTSYRPDPSDILLVLVTLFALGIRLFRLDDLPAEMWGDVITHYQLAQRVMSGHYYLDYEFGGDGPLFSYLVAALAALFGLSFTTIKLATVLVGTAIVPVVYLLGRQLFESRRIGLIAAFLTAVSFWDITFSRQAKPYILVALFAGLAVLLAARHQPIPAGVVLGLGMYTQAAFWGAPVAFLLAPWALLIAAEVAIPFIYVFAGDPGALVGSSSYMGEKLHAHLSPPEVVLRVLDNIWLNAISFNIRGDTTFRHNIPGHAHLDPLTGLLFLLGLALLVERIVRKRDYPLLWWLLIPFLVVQIPSVLDMHPENVPAMGRMVGVIPFVFVMSAFGIDWLGTQGIRRLSGRIHSPTVVVWALLGSVMALITVLNLRNYFVVYPQTLPNHNTPFGGIIAEQINRTPATTFSILVGCCWGDWGQPEPDGVVYRVDTGHPILTAGSVDDLRQIVKGQVPPGSRVVLYSSPQESTFSLAAVRTLLVRDKHMLRRDGWDVSWVVDTRRVGRPVTSR